MGDRQKRLLALIEQATEKPAYIGAEEEGEDVEGDEKRSKQIYDSCVGVIVQHEGPTGLLPWTCATYSSRRDRQVAAPRGPTGQLRSVGDEHAALIAEGVPERPVLMMTAPRHVAAANCLICGWKMCIERVGKVIARDDHKSHLMTRRHYAQAAGFEIECARLAHTGQRVDHDHHSPFETLPAFRGVNRNTG